MWHARYVFPMISTQGSLLLPHYSFNGIIWKHILTDKADKMISHFQKQIWNLGKTVYKQGPPHGFFTLALSGVRSFSGLSRFVDNPITIASGNHWAAYSMLDGKHIAYNAQIMISWYGHAFRIIGPLCGESLIIDGFRWQGPSNADFRHFFVRLNNWWINNRVGVYSSCHVTLIMDAVPSDTVYILSKNI